MGIRFRGKPGGEANDILLHLNLRDLSKLLQPEVLGIVGVNLIYAAFYQRTSPEGLSKVEASLERIEIDFIDLRGPLFQAWNRLDLLRGLVRENLADGRSPGPSDRDSAEKSDRSSSSWLG